MKWLPILLLLSTPLWAAEHNLPDPTLTPGAVRSMSLKELCTTKWGKDARAVTTAMKRQVFANYDYTGNDDPKCDNPDNAKRRCEIDHLASRELAGDDVVENLMVQTYGGPCNAGNKDRLENKLHKMVCAKPQEIQLPEAQQALIQNWKEAFKLYVDPKGCENGSGKP